MTPLIVIVYIIAILTFLGFSWIAIKHAARFRYLSTRTVYLTIFYVTVSAILFVLSLGVLITLIVW